ncbi:MAG TPA: hypothetical protein VF297_32450 [Pyrinomonadaceae bacterium]
MIAATAFPQLAPPPQLPADLPRQSPTAVTPEPLPGYVLTWTLVNYFSTLAEADAARVESEYGLDRQACESIGLRAAPTPTHVLFALHGVAERFGWLKRWPAPFSFDGEHLRLHTPSYGIIFPVWRDYCRAWMHYRSASDTSPRWVTSAHAPGGSKAQASVHVTNPHRALSLGVIQLVVHPLEAEAIALGGVIPVVAVNGLPPSSVIIQLRETLPSLRAVNLDLAEPGPFVKPLEHAGLKVEVLT